MEQKPEKLMSAGFLSLLVTQFLGATNDNTFRWLAIGVGKQFVGAENPAGILMAGTACFVAPYLLLAAYAGYLADRFSKRTVIVACKIAEVFIMVLGMVMIVAGSKLGLFAVVAMMGAQSALFAPSKAGTIPELLPESRIPAANGLFGLATVISTVVGTAVGNVLTDLTVPRGQNRWWISATVLMGIAALGLLASLFVKRLPAANPVRRFPWDAPRQTWRDMKTLAASPALLRVAGGLAFFWSLGTLAHLNIDQFAFAGGAVEQRDIVWLLVSLVIGIGLGSVLAGYLSGGRVELGILPLGALGLVVSSCLLFLTRGSLFEYHQANEPTAVYVWACIFLFLLGTSAGLFHVPLEAFIQHRSPARSRGAVLASANFITFVGVLLASLLFLGLRHPVHEGSVENLPKVVQAELSAAERATISERVDDFKSSFMQDPTGAPETYWDDLPNPQARQALAARLAWAEWEMRQELKGGADRPEFFARYQEMPLLALQVIDEAAGHSLLRPRDVFLVCGLMTIPVLVYVVVLIPQASVRFVVWLASRIFYRIRLYGVNHIPREGPVVLVANHVSWLDGILLMLVSPRPVRMVVWRGSYFRSRLLRKLADVFGAILITSGPKSIKRGIDTARQGLAGGDVIGIFPEGGISRTGQVQAFRPGLTKIVEGTGAVMVPVCLADLWGSAFSYSGGRFFWKWPRRFPYPISIFFGKPLPAGTTLHEVRQAVMELGAESVNKRQQPLMSLPQAMIRACKKRLRASKIADSSDTDMSGGNCLMRTLIVRRLLRRHVLAPDEQHVGILLPPSAGAVIANMALALDRRVSANLNYTVSSEVLNQCIESAGIRHVVTSRRFMSKMDFRLNAQLVYLEDFKDKVTWQDKLASATAAFVTPSFLLERSLQLQHIRGSDVVTVIFTSGSTGTPKGVMLTYDNIASNVEAIDQLIKLTPRDVILGVLPFFHSFGYTVTLWTVMALDVKAAYHFSPIDGKRIGKLAEEHGATILLATPTFLRNYLRRCTPEQFRTLDVAVAGAEKLPHSLSQAFEERFGLRPVEGYGCTELSPLVSVNIPPSRAPKVGQVGLKEGSVGRPIPSVVAKVVDLETGEPLPPGRDGMLWIKGPNVMKGYLNEPEKTAEVVQDGWYMTGDLAHLDEDGFIFITGRESRFSKIGGEMVPHVLIEDALNRILQADEEAGPKAVVTAVPDERKGERLIVLHTPVDKSPEELCAALLAENIPNLYLPSADCFFELSEMPVLGTGKLDLKRMRDVALERTRSRVTE